MDLSILNLPNSLDFSLQTAVNDIRIEWARPYTTFYLRYTNGPSDIFRSLLKDLRHKSISYVATVNVSGKEVRIFLLSPEAASTILRMSNVDAHSIFGYLRYKNN